MPGFHLVQYAKGWKVKDDEGREYSKRVLSEKRAKAQQKALWAAYKRGEFHRGAGFTMYGHGKHHITIYHGAGWFGNVITKIKGLASRAAQSVFNVAAKAVGTKVRVNYPPKVRAVMEKYGSGVVEELLIRRAPIINLVDKALNFISLGKWAEVKQKYAYDKLFHLSMIVALRMPDGAQKRLIVEKNEVINISDKFKTGGEEEYYRVNVPCCITFGTLIGKGKELRGDAFFKYDAFNNNCQDFLISILTANGLLTPENQAFIKQDVGSLLKELPSYISPFANLTTNIAGLADRVLEGEGRTAEGAGICPSRMACARKKEDKAAKPGSGVAAEKVFDIPALRGKILEMRPIGFKSEEQREAERDAEREYYAGVAAYHRARRPNPLSGRMEAGLLEQMFPPAMPEPPAHLARERYTGPVPPRVVQAFVNSMERAHREREAAEFQEAARRAGMNQPAEGRGKRCDCVGPSKCGGTKQYTMPFKDYMEEHRQLIKVLDDIASKAKGLSKKQASEPAFKRGRGKPPGYMAGFCSPKVEGGVRFSRKSTLTEEQRATRDAQLAEQRRAQQADMAANPLKYEPKSYDPTDGGRLAPCWIRRALDRPEGGLSFGHLTSLGMKEPADCEAIQQAQIAESNRRQYNSMSPFQKFAKGFVDVATKVADFAVKPLELIPGVGRVASQVYQNFAPPGSEYYGDNLIKGFQSMAGEGKPSSRFMKQLAKLKVSPATYLAAARAAGKRHGYKPSEIDFATDGEHKLVAGGTPFGRVGYGDYIIYTLTGNPIAESKRNTFHKSHTKIKGDWKDKKYSANNLALRVLW